MDLVDHFVRDGVFGQNRHEHIFTKGEPQSVREEWLAGIDRMCKTAGIGYVVRQCNDEDGNPGYEFGFADGAAYAAFVFNAYGDLERPRGHIQGHRFDNESPEYREAFFLAAEAHLGALGIKHDWRMHNGELQFAFDRFSDRMVFQALLEQGTIDASAKGIGSARKLQRRLGTPVSHPGIAAELGLDL